VIAESFGVFVASWSATKFAAEFLKDPHYDPEALFFAVEHATGRVVGTCLAWHHAEERRLGRLHW
jgi:hypothetical protein